MIRIPVIGRTLDPPGDQVRFLNRYKLELSKFIDFLLQSARTWPDLRIVIDKKPQAFKPWLVLEWVKRSLIIRYNHGFLELAIDDSVTYPGTSVRLNLVARALEFGTNFTPARPMFRPVLNRLLGEKNARII